MSARPRHAPGVVCGSLEDLEPPTHESCLLCLRHCVSTPESCPESESLTCHPSLGFHKARLASPAGQSSNTCARRVVRRCRADPATAGNCGDYRLFLESVEYSDEIAGDGGSDTGAEPHATAPSVLITSSDRTQYWGNHQRGAPRPRPRSRSRNGRNASIKRRRRSSDSTGGPGCRGRTTLIPSVRP